MFLLSFPNWCTCVLWYSLQLPWLSHSISRSWVQGQGQSHSYSINLRLLKTVNLLKEINNQIWYQILLLLYLCRKLRWTSSFKKRIKYNFSNPLWEIKLCLLVEVISKDIKQRSILWKRSLSDEMYNSIDLYLHIQVVSQHSGLYTGQPLR